MSIAELLEPEFNKLSSTIHQCVYAAFGMGSGKTFPTGEIMHQEVQYGMVTQGLIVYSDGSCLSYLRHPEDDHGFYTHEGYVSQLSCDPSDNC